MSSFTKRRKITLATPVALAAQTSDVTVDLGDIGGPWDALIVYIRITVVTAGSVTVVINGSPNSGTNWFPLGTTAALSAVANTALRITGPISSRLQLLCDVSGGGNVTFAIDGIELVRTGV